MEYSIIDSQMTNENKPELVKIAEEHGFTFYSEMLHVLHCKDGKSPAEISELLFDEKGNMLATKDGVYYTLRKYGWLILRNKKHIKKKFKKEVKMCACCGLAPVHTDLHRLCMTCYKNNGHKCRGNGIYDDPLGESSALNVNSSGGMS